MGKRGPHPLPRETKLERGTLRPHRERDAAAPPAADELEPPADLEGLALKFFHEIVSDMRDAGTLARAYRRTIAHLARVEARAAALREEMRGHDLVREVENTNGVLVPKTNPWLTQLLEHEKEARHLYGILGLTPPGIVRAPKTRKAETAAANPFAAFAE